MNRLLEEVGLRDSKKKSGPSAEEIIDIIDGARGLGHTLSRQEELGTYFSLHFQFKKILALSLRTC